MRGIDFSKESFCPVIRFPSDVSPIVLDLTVAGKWEQSEYSIGKYLERRGIYTTELFAGPKQRTIHLGIDLGAPVGTPVFAPCSGRVKFRGYNPAAGDYGYCLITEHDIQGVKIFFLFGHLGCDVMLLGEHQEIERGQVCF
jgi:murein DD-endopeptidase MepM/ murein hydrolase activator NlpD